ncbi:MFS transporter (plasmid) [Stutzerimonas stutzeri]|uniref:MFS transporter n=1 Tax=Pseudomonas extremaustralis TaxID=359110 RepID=UPI002307D864|nr:MFS transporter [Pseudomonas extremaustralis]MDB1107859.1 MFS transporter [Pseudomonas extremaustralis]WQN29917.1 MFS transporter [Stutzerimonas stutzeri]
MNNNQSHWDKSYEWKAVTLLTLGFGLVGLDRWIIAPLFPSMMRDLNLDYQDLGNIIAVLGVAWGIFAIFTGPLSDRIGRRRVLIPSIIGFSLLAGLSGMATGMASLLLIRVLMGAFEGAFCPTSIAATDEASHPLRRGRNQGILQCSFALFGMGFAPIIATQLLDVVPSWRWVFVLSALPGLVIAFLLYRVLRDFRARAESAAPAVPVAPTQSISSGSLFAHRNVVLGMLAVVCAMTGIFVLGAMIPSYLVDFLKLSSQQMGFVTSALGLGGTCGVLILPTLSDWLGRRWVTVASFVGATAFLAAFSRTGPSPIELFVLLFFAAGFAFGIVALVTGPIAMEAAPIGKTASVAGLIIGAGEIFGGGVAPALAGHLANTYGIASVLTLAMGGLALGCVIGVFLKETAPRKQRVAPAATNPV